MKGKSIIKAAIKKGVAIILPIVSLLGVFILPILPTNRNQGYRLF